MLKFYNYELLQLLLITHTLLILDSNNLKFMNTECILLKQYYLEMRSAFKHRFQNYSSFNCIKSLKMLTIIAKTSNHNCAQSLGRYHLPNYNHHNIRLLPRKQQNVACFNSKQFFFWKKTKFESVIPPVNLRQPYQY